MMNLKKTLAVVLAFAMIFSMGVSTFAAYSDVEEGTTVGEAVGILSNLGIFTGFEDGTFKPEDTVTRAQMAAIICRTLGYEDQAQSSGGSTAFSDVAADHWAAGYINVAQSLGIINGMGDGTFAPEEKVTYEQAVKMIVCALNYELVAANKGGYPTGYLSVASSEGITKGANGKVGDAAKRGTVAVLVYNSLEVRLFDQDSWTTNGEDSYAKSDDTILSRYLEVEKWEGIVTSDPYTYIAENGYDADTTPEIEIKGFESYYEDGKLVKDADESPVKADASLVDVEGLFGKKVIAYIGAEEDDETGNVMVYAINEKNNANKVVSISGTQLVDEEDKEWEIKDQISYRNVGSNKVYDLDVDSDTEYYVNYEKKDLSDVVLEKDKDDKDIKKNLTTADIATLLVTDDYCGGTVEFISNDNDEAIEFVMIKAYQDESVIEEVVEEDGIFSFTLYNANGQLDEIDTDDEDVYGEIYKDGVKVDVTALAANDTVSTLLIGGDIDAKMLFVSSETVEGSVDSYDDETVTIGGVDYEISVFYGKAPSALKDEEGIFFLNVDGQIAHNETDTAAGGNYGLVLAVDYESGITDGYVMQVAMADGSVVEYDLAAKAKYYTYNDKGETVTTGTDDEETAKEIAKVISGKDTFTAKLQVKNAVNSVFKFTFKNDEITKIKALQGNTISSYLKENTKKYDAEAMSYGSAEFDEKTVVFAIEPVYGDKSESVIEDDDVATGAVSEFFADEDDNVIFAGLDEEDGIVKVVVGFDLKASVPEDSDAVIVTSKKTVTYDDDDAVQITGIQAGEEVSFIIYDEDAEYTNADPEDLDKGDVILVAAANGEGVVADFKLLFDASKKEVSAEALAGDASDDIFNAAGTLDKAATKDSNSKFYISANVKNEDGDVWALSEDGITIKASANYTLVDYSESTKNPEIDKKSSNAVFSTSSKYDTYVFVRVYDDVLTEVVAYRFLAE